MHIDKAMKTLNYLGRKRDFLKVSKIMFDHDCIQVEYLGTHDTVVSPVYKGGLSDAIHKEITRLSN